MKKPATQKKNNSFKNDLIEKKLTPSITFRGLPALTESLQIQVSTT